MGTFTLILIIALGVSGVVLGFLLWKKLPQLRIVDPESDKETQEKRKKHGIMRQRMERAGGKHVQKINKSIIQPIGSGLQDIIRKVAGKLTAVERRYQEKQKKDSGSGLDKATMKRLLEEGRQLTEEGAWDRAEKKFIEVISSDPKNSEAYENLGRLYQSKKDYELARETFSFLAKLLPKDASISASLGEVEGTLGHHVKAHTQFKKAVKLSPKNPKYLDFLIKSTIEMGDRHEATSVLDRLRKVNPDNKKIEVFEKQISEMNTLISEK